MGPRKIAYYGCRAIAIMDGVTKTTLPLKSIIKYVNPCLSVLNVKQEQHSDAFFNSIKFNPIVYTSFERVQDT